MRGVAALMLGAVALALALDGAAAFGRLALRLGLPQLAAPLLADPMWRGVALSRQGAHAAAEDAYRRAGPRATFNRAGALARLGRYGDAVEGYDAVLHRDPADGEAVENRALAAALRDIVPGEILPGTEAAGDGSATDPATTAFEAAVGSTGNAPRGPDQRRSTLPPEVALVRDEVLQTKDAGAIPASRSWLATFPDEPGRYLEALIAAEQARRRAQGQEAPPPEVPW